MKYFSMFSGIGGFEYGIEQSDKDLECIGCSEIDYYASNIYRRHYPKHKNFGDVTKIEPKDLRDFELLVAGFPCQSFSNSGLRRGFSDTRGTLFFEIARICAEKKPKYFLLENVKGLLYHDKGNTFQKMLRIFSELGYYVEWEIHNSKNHGIPQSRERIFIKGYSREECGGEILHQRRNGTKITRNVNNALKKINTARIQGQRVYDVTGLSTTLTASSGGQGAKTGLYMVDEPYIKVKSNTAKGYHEAFIGDGVRIDYLSEKNDSRGRVQSEKIGTLTCVGSWGTLDESLRVRRLTPIECERLQGFPDDWTKYTYDGSVVGNTQRYKCIGNAVTTNVVRDIINKWEAI